MTDDSEKEVVTLESASLEQLFGELSSRYSEMLFSGASEPVEGGESVSHFASGNGLKCIGLHYVQEGWLMDKKNKERRGDVQV